MKTTTLSEKALAIAVEKRENAWQRWCKATNEGAKKHWSNTLDKYAGLVRRIEERLGR